MGLFRHILCAVFILVAQQLAAAEVTGKIRVIDGDTFDVGTTRVRLFGIDAPEQDQPCTSARGETWACGAWVSSEVRSRYEGRSARCEPMDTDRYGRTVARCHVGGEDVASVLVQDGLAFAFRRYSMDYDLDEKGAAIRNAGLHSSTVQSPAAYRAGGAPQQTVRDDGCTIKGNISSKGVRIYHRPGQRDYDATRISTSKGERWFCSEAEAKAAGWRPARR